MATSRESVLIDARTWVDIYADTGITVGVKLIIQNTSDGDVKLSESLGEPTSTTGYNSISPFTYLTSAITPIGVWAYSSRGARLQVEEA